MPEQNSDTPEGAFRLAHLRLLQAILAIEVAVQSLGRETFAGGVGVSMQCQLREVEDRLSALLTYDDAGAVVAIADTLAAFLAAGQ